MRWMTNAVAGVRRDRPEPRRPAQRRDPRRRHRHREPVVAQHPRRRASQVLTGAGVENPFGAQPLTAHEHAPARRRRASATTSDEAGEQMSYALDVLEARGDLDPDSPEAQQFVRDYLKDVTMHEVGHTLGLRHNFRASRAYTDAAARRPGVHRARNGITGSVMEYAPINLNAPGEPRALRHAVPAPRSGPTTTGRSSTPTSRCRRPSRRERPSWRSIAARSAEPQLAYGTDEDNFLGIDPESLQFDLGNDADRRSRSKRIAIARTCSSARRRASSGPTEDYAVLRRSVQLRDRATSARAVGVLARQIGGVRTLRDCPGSGRDPLQPVPVADQREALDVHRRQPARGRQPARLADAAAQARHRLQRALRRAVRGGEGSAATDYSPSEQVLGLQRALLGRADERRRRHARCSTAASKAPAGAGRALRCPSSTAACRRRVWSELDGSGDIAPLRRELQRDHVNRARRPAAAPRRLEPRRRAQPRARAGAGAAGADRRRRRSAAALSEEARAHLPDSADTLRQALSARLQRAGRLKPRAGDRAGTRAALSPRFRCFVAPECGLDGSPAAAIVRRMTSGQRACRRPATRPAGDRRRPDLEARRRRRRCWRSLVAAAAESDLRQCRSGCCSAACCSSPLLLLLVFAAAGTWHPRRMPRWLAQVLAVVLAAPIATAAGLPAEHRRQRGRRARPRGPGDGLHLHHRLPCW